MSPTRRHPKATRGQAMAEYAVINWILILSLVFVTSCPVPTMAGSGPGQNVIELFLNAYQAYYDSFYFVLNLPFP